MATVPLLDVRGIDLQATDATAPAITPQAQPNLWNPPSYWIRGVWPLSFQATDDSGVCSMSEQVGTVTLTGPTDTTPNQHSWTQCPSPQTMTSEVDTSKFPDGPLPLKLIAGDAAAPANVAAPSESVNVDNQPVAVSLAGPTDAPSTAGPQTVTATASAGPSGVAAVNCAVDGSAFQRYLGSSAQVSVQGIGRHQVACYAQNNAIGLDGSAAQSPLETWDVSIRQPTVSTLAFVSVVDRLHCSRRREKVEIPAHWTTGTVNGKPVRVRVPAERVSVRVVRCRPHVVLHRVLRHGRWEITRTVVLPHSAKTTRERIAYGARATVSGWIGTASGVALAGQPVHIYAAADNGKRVFRLAATVFSRGNGSWTASLPPGPSRLVEALYGGNATTEPSSSTTSSLTVPARLELQIRPRTTHWGGTIIIRGRLAGGYVPPSGETILLWIGWHGGSTEIGHVYANPDGSFRTRYTFLRGNGRETYRLWASSVRESDYPFAPSASRKVSLVVSQ